MPNYRTIVFDLDETLTEPTQEMISSASYDLEQFGIKETDPERLKLFTQVPLLHCFEEHFGLSQAQTDQAFIHYWYYAGIFGVKKNVPYEGIPSLLAKLHEKGTTLCIATARKTKNAEQILKTCNLDGYFAFVFGASEDETRRTKKMILFDLLCELPEYSSEDTLMVGDRVVDLSGAQDNGIDSMAVTYGQETVEDLSRTNPTYMVNNVKEMAGILLDEKSPEGVPDTSKRD